MAELHKLLGIKPVFTTTFHPSGNGRVERLHGTLKSVLRKLCADKPREWHRYLIPAMFALREIPSDRTGFSPFELLYGRAVRGPLSVPRDKSCLPAQFLELPDPSHPFVLRTDASSHGLRAVLLQYYEDQPHPVVYASRKLQDRERRYSTIERECLALVYGIQRFDYYLRGKEFIIEVDHKPLIYLERFKGKNDRVLRWALGLQAYKYRVVHVAGTDNLGADLLSRSSPV